MGQKSAGVNLHRLSHSIVGPGSPGCGMVILTMNQFQHWINLGIVVRRGETVSTILDASILLIEIGLGPVL